MPMGCPSGPRGTSYGFARGVSGRPTSWNTFAAAAPAGDAAAASTHAAVAPVSSSCRLASCLRSSSSSVASLRSSSHASHTARVDTCGGLTPSSSTSDSMRFTPRAPPVPTAATAICAATSTTCFPRAYAPGASSVGASVGALGSGATPGGRMGASGMGSEGANSPPAMMPALCSSGRSSRLTLALIASSLGAENAAPARAASACASALRLRSMVFTSSRMFCSSRSSALVRSIWSASASFRSRSASALNGSLMMGCAAASSGTSARASINARAIS
mmetsp:Transcript_8753/g.36666  ORF Transcript_8753/g.36666 Transcript_8753/m.36666 type:complete len:276 (-) Transcript_8753:765-1592(-)